MKRAQDIFDLLPQLGFVTGQDDGEDIVYREPAHNLFFISYIPGWRKFMTSQLEHLPPVPHITFAPQTRTSGLLGIQDTHRMWATYAASLTAADLPRTHTARAAWLYARMHQATEGHHTPYTLVDCGQLAALTLPSTLLRGYMLHGIPVTTIREAVTRGTHPGLVQALYPNLATPRGLASLANAVDQRLQREPAW